MASLSTFLPFLFLAGKALCQQQCYYGVGAQYRGPPSLVPCNNTGTSACCLLGSVCLTGNACYDGATGNLYQYGCTDIPYEDAVCPYKCGFDPDRSPWTAMEWCADYPPGQVNDTYICHGPESCGCDWGPPTSLLLLLAPRGCSEMGGDAMIALYAPIVLAPYVSLPSTLGGSTGYFSAVTISGTPTWLSTAVPGYTPTPFTQLTTYQRKAPRSKVWVNEGANADASTYASARSWTGSGPTPTDGNIIATSPPTMTTSALPSSLTHNSSEPLSTGAKIGLGVGIGLGIPIVLLLSLIALYSIRKQTRTKPSPLFVQPSTPQDIPSPGSARPSHVPQQYWRHYQGQQVSPVYQQQQQISPVYEPKEPQSPSELPGDRERVEVR